MGGLTPGLLPAGMIEHLKSRHSEAHRHYHTWAHVEALLAWLDQVGRQEMGKQEIEGQEIGGQIDDWPSMELAILFHDAVYDPYSKDNEAESAALMMSELSGLVAQETLERAKTLILATIEHRLPDAAETSLQGDCALFLDMDLSILGTEPAAFDAYEDAIRREYTFVPDDRYRAARSAILQAFLKRDRLFFTDYFHDRLDRQARSNLARSIDRLIPG